MVNKIKTLWRLWVTPKEADPEKAFREQTLRLIVAFSMFPIFVQIFIILLSPNIDNSRLLIWISFLILTIAASQMIQRGQLNSTIIIMAIIIFLLIGFVQFHQGYWSGFVFILTGLGTLFFLFMISRPSSYFLITLLFAEYMVLSIWQLNTTSPYPNPLPINDPLATPTLAILRMAIYLFVLTNIGLYLSKEFNKQSTNVRTLIGTLELQVKELQDNQNKLENYADQERQHAQQLTTLNKVGLAVSTLRDLASVLEIIFEQTQQSIQLDAFFIGLYDDHTNEISFPIMYDSGERWHEPTTQATPGDYILRLVKTREPFLINRTSEEVATPIENEDMVGETSKKSASIMFAPLITRERVIGGISAQSYALNAYDQDSLVLFSGIGHQTAIAIENARLYSSIQRELTERKQAEQALSAYAKELERSNAEKVKAQQELKSYANDLERSNKDLQDFASIASHDLQEPLRKIQMLSDRFVNRYEGTLDQRGSDYLIRMQNASARMQALIEDLLAFSRLSNQEKSFQRTDLNDIIQMVLDDLKLTLEENDATVNCNQLPQIEANPTQMQQLFQNLLQNGLKFRQLSQPPIIKIDYTTLDTNEIEIVVADNGIGFDAKYGKQIFGMFQRLHGRSTYEGTGIGLAICQRIVEQHNGTITATGEKDKGATFTIQLPLKQSS